jgi:hypothetical protein
MVSGTDSEEGLGAGLGFATGGGGVATGDGDVATGAGDGARDDVS